MTTTWTCKRVADTKCPTCEDLVPVVEHRYVTKSAPGAALGDWSEKTVVMVDREVHCDSHFLTTRSIYK